MKPLREENQRWARPRRDHGRSGNSCGDRPPARDAGLSHPVVRAALAAAHDALGITLTPEPSSTDANIPIQLKIPAITIGTGGQGMRRPHTAGETFDTTDAWQGDSVRARCDRAARR